MPAVYHVRQRSREDVELQQDRQHGVFGVPGRQIPAIKIKIHGIRGGQKKKKEEGSVNQSKHPQELGAAATEILEGC